LVNTQKFFINIFIGIIMKIKAVIDRFEEDDAVLLVGEKEDVHIVPRSSLPHGAIAGLWLLVEVEGKHIFNAVVDEEETIKVKERLNRFRRDGDNANNNGR
jgi:hypothetical protein